MADFQDRCDFFIIFFFFNPAAFFRGEKRRRLASADVGETFEICLPSAIFKLFCSQIKLTLAPIRTGSKPRVASYDEVSSSGPVAHC